MNNTEGSKERAYITIDLNNLEHNVKEIQSVLNPNCEIMAVLKANAYGHGLEAIATHLNKIGVKTFAVATIEEGIRLRNNGTVGEVLIFGYTPVNRARDLHYYNLTQTLINYDYTIQLNKQGYEIKAHLKVDTGMHRLGFDKTEEIEIIEAFSLEHIEITGIYTHLATSDSLLKKDVEFVHKQLNSFYKVIDRLKEENITIPKTHIQSTYGILNYPELECDYVRAGVVLYGVSTFLNDNTKIKLDVKPVLSLKSKVILIRKVLKGESVGYGRTFVAKRDSLIAVLPMGYADGYPRSLSFSNSYVLVNGQQALVVGKICMDQMTIDVTDISNVQVGDTVTLIGSDGNSEVPAVLLADNSLSITPEILGRLGSRLDTIYIK